MKVLRITIYTTLTLIGLILLVFVIVHFQQETALLDEKARAQAPGLFTSLTNGTTHYKLQGNKDGELVVLIHGGGITGMEVWNQNADFLVEQGFQVLTYDLFGRGYSDRLAEEYTPELLLNQLNELITALNLNDSLSIISMSMGSMVALDFATQHPDRVNSIIMLDPAITGDYRPNPLLKFPLLSDLLLTLYWYPRAVENQRKEFVNASVFPPYAKRLEYFMNFEGYKHMNYSTWMHILNQDKSASLTSLKNQSVLLLYGDKDPYFSITNAKKLTSLFPNLAVDAVTNAGHMPHFEKPDVVNPLLLDFLKRTSSQPTTEKPE